MRALCIDLTKYRDTVKVGAEMTARNVSLVIRKVRELSDVQR